MESTADKDVFTTGEVAKILHCSLQSIIRAFDKGTIKGWRVPGSSFRRIPRDEVLRFIRESGYEGTGLDLEPASLRTQRLESTLRSISNMEHASLMRKAAREALKL